MDIALIMPAMGHKPGQAYVASWKMEPLGLAALAALTPAEHRVRLWDDRVERLPDDLSADLVAINVETYTARRAYGLARALRDRGVPVVMGGYHATLMPEETAGHCDAVVCGEAEAIWPQLLRDAEAGCLKRRYDAPAVGACAPARPRRDIFAGKRYLPITLLETGRGCRFACRFCSIAGFFRSEYVRRPVEDIVDELAMLRARNVFLIDDNIVSDPERAKALFRALIPLGIRWISQGSITMADDPELLDLMRRSGCAGVLIGFESLDDETLRQMGKGWNTRRTGYDESIRRMHAHGIAIYATFMFGYDNDDAASFERTLAFAEHQRFYLAAFNHVVPFPGTALYDSLAGQGRLLHPRWWLAPDVRFGDVVFQPARMTPEALAERCFEARKAFYRLGSTLRRATNWRANAHGVRQFAQYAWLNVFSERAVHQRQGLPLGSGPG